MCAISHETSLLKKEMTAISESLRPFNLNHLFMAVLFNDGTNATFATDERMTGSHRAFIDFDALIYQKKFFDSSGNYHIHEQDSGLNRKLQEHLNLHAVYSFSRIHAEGRFIFAVLKEGATKNPHSSHKDSYERTIKRVEKQAIRFLDAAINKVLRFDSSYNQAFILTDKALRDAVIKQDFEKGIKLSYIERKCIWLSFSGKTAKETAKDLNVSHRTVEKYLTNIRKQFDKPLPQVYLECIYRGIIGKFISV